TTVSGAEAAMIRNTRCPVLSGRAVLSPDSRGAAADVCGAEFWVTVTLLWVRRRGVAKASPRPVLGLYGAAAPFGTPVRPAATPRQQTCRIRQRIAGFSGISPRVRAPPAVWLRSAPTAWLGTKYAAAAAPAGLVLQSEARRFSRTPGRSARGSPFSRTPGGHRPRRAPSRGRAAHSPGPAARHRHLRE